jgi:hypothetical protein
MPTRPGGCDSAGTRGRLWRENWCTTSHAPSMGSSPREDGSTDWAFVHGEHLCSRAASRLRSFRNLEQVSVNGTMNSAHFLKHPLNRTCSLASTAACCGSSRRTIPGGNAVAGYSRIATIGDFPKRLELSVAPLGRRKVTHFDKM